MTTPPQTCFGRVRLRCHPCGAREDVTRSIPDDLIAALIAWRAQHRECAERADAFMCSRCAERLDSFDEALQHAALVHGDTVSAAVLASAREREG